MYYLAFICNFYVIDAMSLLTV